MATTPDLTVTEVRVSRMQLVPTPGRSYRVAWKWSYYYAVGNLPKVDYGPGLADLRDHLRHKFPKAKIIKDWEK